MKKKLSYYASAEDIQMLDSGVKQLGVKTYTAVLREGLKCIVNRSPIVDEAGQAAVSDRVNIRLNNLERVQVGEWQRKYGLSTPAKAIKRRLFSKYHANRQPMDKATEDSIIEKDELIQEYKSFFYDLLQTPEVTAVPGLKDYLEVVKVRFDL